MLRRDRRLGMVPREDFARRGLGQPRKADLDLPCIPEGSVLFLEQEQATSAVLASREPSRMKMHQRKQRRRLGGLSDRVIREDVGQPYRFGAELTTDGRVRVRGEVALREDEIEDRAHAGETRRVLLTRELVRGRWPRSQALARSTEAFVDIGFAGEQPSRDLPHFKAAQDLQGQDDLRFRRDRVVATDEQHAEQVVLHIVGEQRAPDPAPVRRPLRSRSPP
jgi:hypothetical protein